MYFKYKILEGNEENLYFDLYYGENIDPNLKIMHINLIKNSKNHIDFTSDVDGKYKFCLQNYQKQGSKNKKDDKNEEDNISLVQLKLYYGYDTEHYNKLVTDHKFDDINLHTHYLNDILTMTLNEADYQKHKEILYHKMKEKMNFSILFWPIFQIFILLFVGIYHVNYLKSFFKSNKFI